MDIQTYLNDTSLLSEDTLPVLKDTVEKYPFYQTARILYLINLFNLHHKDFGTELKKSAIFIADRSVLFRLVEGVNYELKETTGNESEIETEDNRPHTVTLIDNFLRQSKSMQTGKQQPSLADLTTDYAAFLESKDDIVPAPEGSNSKEGTSPKLKGGDLIDEFIKTSQGKQRIEIGELSDEYTSPELSYEEEEIYTSNMVNIYIKQRRYKEALEILRKICLTNPEKNTTFAAQIQLLEVILANNK